MLPSYAKINLALELVGIRPDGYTELRTIFQSIDLKDTLSFEHAPPGELEVTCDDEGVPSGRENLVGKAAHLLLMESGIRAGARIHIAKRIPHGAGLGGGSGNAAVALVALDRLWETRLSAEDRHRLASRLGSDVPFFLYGGTALGLGRGEEVYPLSEPSAAELIIALPPFRVPTSEAYERVKRRLTPRSGGHTIWRFASRGLPGVASYSFVINELEEAATEGQEGRSGLLRSLKRRFLESGASCAALCGSGSALFGLFAEKGEEAGSRTADLVARSVVSEFPEVRFYRCRTLGSAAYRRAIYGSSGT
jgi:4-diphosphocytidyl-2-C-methyl-D-erythritol kinase